MAERSKEEEDGFTSHLEELHVRFLRALAALAIGVGVGWWLYPEAFALLTEAVKRSLELQQGSMVLSHPAEAFFVRFKFAAVTGLVLASPYILWELWGFVRPGLTEREIRAARPVVPAACFLFLAGAALAYYMLPKVLDFFKAFTPADVKPLYPFTIAINFPLKLMAAFGIAFQMPVVLLGLVWAGVLTPRVLVQQWRVAVLAIAVLAAVVTPTPDPFNMAILMLPLLILYFATVFFAWRIERGRRRDGA